MGRGMVREPLNKSARARRSLCGITRRGFDERGLVIPNKRVETRWVARKGPSRQAIVTGPGAGEAASRTRRDSAVATATVTRHGTHDLRLLRLKRAPRRLVQRFLSVERGLSPAIPHQTVNAVFPYTPFRRSLRQACADKVHPFAALDGLETDPINIGTASNCCPSRPCRRRGRAVLLRACPVPAGARGGSVSIRRARPARLHRALAAARACRRYCGSATVGSARCDRSRA